MKRISEYFQGGAKEFLLGGVLALLLVLEIFTGGYFGFSENTLSSQPEIFLKISEIQDPTIDSGAAAISLEEETCRTGETLPGSVWFLFLLSMGVLIFGNFAFAIYSKKHLEWLPEAGYVLVALLVWWFVDPCHQTLWFPVTLVKISLLIFALYVYLLEKEANRREV